MPWITCAARFASASKIILAFDTALLDPPGDVHSPASYAAVYIFFSWLKQSEDTGNG